MRRSKKRLKWTALVVAAVASPQVWSTASVAAELHRDTGRAMVCSHQRFSVKSESPPAEALTVAGTLCGPDSVKTRIVLITSHGATYNHLYWDWPQNPPVYSFVRHLPARVSVLNVDLLGSGESSHPSSATLTQQAEALMLHQLVGTMRARGFKKIVLVG